VGSGNIDDRKFNVKDKDEITGSPIYFSVEEWKTIWNPYGWNHFLVRVEGNPPTIEVFLNGHKVHEFTDTQTRLSATGKIGLQVHEGADDYAWPTGAVARFRNIRVTPR
jgi:hypothetical protein